MTDVFVVSVVHKGVDSFAPFWNKTGELYIESECEGIGTGAQQGKIWKGLQSGFPDTNTAGAEFVFNIAVHDGLDFRDGAGGAGPVVYSNDSGNNNKK